MKPPEPVEENLFDFDDAKLSERKIGMLPGSLGEALAFMRESALMREALGEHTFQKYLEAKTAEWDAYRLSVSPWELERYLERY
jgi:glutamine synthetase